MKPETKTAINNGAAKAASHILGGAHLLFQSLADGCLNLEGTVVNKLTGEHYDSVRERRFNETRSVQEQVKRMFAAFDVQVNNADHIDAMDNITGL